MTEAEGVAALKAAGIETAVRDAQLLWAGAQEDPQTFEVFIARRGRYREPVSRILERRAFWEHDFLVTPDVLDPRPDTETLVEHALSANWTTLLDLGTGSGCIALSLLAARPGATGVATDISRPALDTAWLNADAIGLLDRVEFAKSNWFKKIDGQFDLIVSNPPYITAEAYRGLEPEVLRYDPRKALTPGGDGLDAYRIICAQAPDYLTPNGHLMVEIGFDQAAPVEALFQAAGFRDIRAIRDINGKDRVIAAVLR